MEAHLEPLLRELIGAELRAERRRRGRTLAQVAADAGVSMQHLSDVERGRKDPSSELLGAILGALGVPLPVLLLRAVDGAVESAAGVPNGPGRVLDLTSSPSGRARRPGLAPSLASRGEGADGHGDRGVRLLTAA